MRQNSEHETLNRIQFLTGGADIILGLRDVPAKAPFDEEMLFFLDAVSKKLMSAQEARAYPDVVTFAFWIRGASLTKLKERFAHKEFFRLGRGAVFHIAPSNVPVNFAYSLAAGLLTGNANIVRVPSKDFPQIGLIAGAFNSALEEQSALMPYICLVRYARDREINDLFSSMADVRVVWGGDATITELRQSPLAPRAEEITFADRYSLAIIDSDAYMEIEDKERVAEDFYNDTFLTDQNACTSPRLIAWMGTRIDEAKKEFWLREHDLARKKYVFQDIQGVDKLTTCCIIAASEPDAKVHPMADNLIVRLNVSLPVPGLMKYSVNSGCFLEYDCRNILELREFCDNKKCQTLAYIGDRNNLLPLLQSGVKGIDRVVPIGRTMDFDLIWDGYDLVERLTRTVTLR